MMIFLLGLLLISPEEELNRAADRHWKARDAIKLKSRAEIEARREEVRQSALRLIGGLPAEKAPLNPRVTGGFQREGYRVENVIFESLPNYRVTANLYLPEGKGPFPAVLGVAGHSRNGKTSATYQHAWIGFAKRGYAVLAFDPAGQGERLMFHDADSGDSFVGIGTGEHIAAGLPAMLIGQGFARYEIWDGIRAVDYLLTRPEIDPKRIAVAGNSGGGTQAAYLAVFEPRLAAAISSCYMTRWRELWRGPGPQDAEQVWPGFVSEGLDFDDFALAFSPKPYLMTTAIRDFFPIDGARATYRRITEIFERLGVSQNAGYFEYDDTHGWSQPRREAAYRWLDKHFLGRDADGAEPPIQVEPESRLMASVDANGQPVNANGSLNAILLQQWQAMQPKRKAAGLEGEALRSVIRARLKLATRRKLTVEGVSEETKDGVRVRRFALARGGDVRSVSARWLLPAGGTGPRETVLAVALGADAEAMARAGRAVLALEIAGFGDHPPAEGRGYSPIYKLAAKAWLLGRSLPGMAVEDLLDTLDWVETQTDVRQGPLRLAARGTAGVPAVLAAALDERIGSLMIEATPESYLSFLHAWRHRNLTGIVIPGVLLDFDLPDAARLLAGRRLVLADPVTAGGRRLRPPRSGKHPHYPHAEWRERIEGQSTLELLTGW
jgi:hypothetical protein